MKMLLSALCSAGLLLSPALTLSQVAAGSMNVRWREGSKDCKANTDAPLQVHPYNPQTFILRENLCATFEGPFMYLLVGSTRALLIDTGDVADPKQMPLAESSPAPAAWGWAFQAPSARGAHPSAPRSSRRRRAICTSARCSGRRLRSGECAALLQLHQLAQRHRTDRPWQSNCRCDPDAESHNETEVTFYDRNTALLFSGDFPDAGAPPHRRYPGRSDQRAADRRLRPRIARSATFSAATLNWMKPDNTFPWESTRITLTNTSCSCRKAPCWRCRLPSTASTASIPLAGGFVMMNSHAHSDRVRRRCRCGSTGFDHPVDPLPRPQKKPA